MLAPAELCLAPPTNVEDSQGLDSWNCRWHRPGTCLLSLIVSSLGLLTAVLQVLVGQPFDIVKVVRLPLL
jgi:hypothetical protein